MKRSLAIALLAAVMLVPPRTSTARAGSSARAISQESAARLLERHFASAGASYVLMDAGTGEILASNWPDLDRPLPLGSLLKPFTAIAYGETHAFEYPVLECKGEAGGCWRPRGHGKIGLAQAIAQSCNAYFRELASRLSAQDVSTALERFGMDPLAPGAHAESLFGAGDAWRASPRALLRAYLEITQRRTQPGAREVVQGLALAARSGTGEAVGHVLNASAKHAHSLDADALVKTGTASCSHPKHASGDGYAVAIYPAQAPRFALLVSVHGAPGSHAAAVAGEMLRALTERR